MASRSIKPVRLVSATVGPKKSHYSQYQLWRDLFPAARGAGADGIELCFRGKLDKHRNIVSGPNLSAIEEVVEITYSEFDFVNLHLSAFMVPLLEYGLGYEFLDKFENVICHLGYADNFIGHLEDKMVLDQLEKILPKERKNKLLIENGSRPINNIRVINRIAQKHKLKKVFDIGHFIIGFYERNEESGAPHDKIANYLTCDSIDRVYLKDGLLNDLARGIKEIHVHYLWWQGSRAVDHYPPGRRMIRHKTGYRAVSEIIKRANPEIITLEHNHKKYNTVRYLKKAFEYTEKNFLGNKHGTKFFAR